MSTNIYFYATREDTFMNKRSEQCKDTRTVSFDQWQTPTAVTHEIMRSLDPVAAYKHWILTERSRDQEMPVYAPNDYLSEGQPVGVKIYNEGKEHVAHFEQWISKVEEQGYTVTAEAW